MKFLLLFALASCLFFTVARSRRVGVCPSGCQCSRARIFCYKVNDLELILGGKFGSTDVTVVDSRISKVTCLSEKKVSKIVHADFRRSSPDSMLCKALRCGDLMSRSLYSGPDVSLRSFVYFTATSAAANVQHMDARIRT